MSRSALLWVLALLVLVGTLARAEDKAEPVADYKTFLASLPKDDPASVTRAIDQYRTAIVPLDTDKHTKAFLEFLDFHDSVCNGVDKVLWEKQKDSAVICVPESNSEEAKLLRRHGLEIRGNGPDGFHVGGVPDYIPQVFSSYLPKSIKRYLELRLAEIREGYKIDAGLQISYARLAQRVANWNKYIKDYKGSPMSTEARTLRAAYLLDLLVGMDNSPLDPATEDRSNNIRVVYENFFRAYPCTYAAKLVRAQYDYFKKEGFFSKTPQDRYIRVPDNRCAEVRAYLDRSFDLGKHCLDISSGYRAVKGEGI